MLRAGTFASTEKGRGGGEAGKDIIITGKQGRGGNQNQDLGGTTVSATNDIVLGQAFFFFFF